MQFVLTPKELSMQLHIHVHGFTLSDSLRTFLERRIYCALSLRYNQIERIAVSLSVNCDHPGVDKQCCQLHIAMWDQGNVSISDTRSNMFVAIERAVDKAARSMTQKLAYLSNIKPDNAGVAMYASTMIQSVGSGLNSGSR